MKCRLLLMAFTIGVAGPAFASGEDPDPEDEKYEGRWERVEVDSEGAGYCLLCGHGVDLDKGGEVIWHRGRKVRICQSDACHEHWIADHELVFREMQPRAGLWDETVAEPPVLGKLWLFVGLWVLAGLVSGAAAAYLAVGRGHPPTAWFLIGLGANVLGLAFLLTRPVREEQNAPEGVPDGLVKVPVTRSPVPCPGCGVTNHPSAVECPACGGTLTPSVDCEANRA